MSQPQISIIGAGISGLCLSHLLAYRGIASVLFERDTAQAFANRHKYGITLSSACYRPLLRYLNIDETSFRRRLAVDSFTGGSGEVDNDSDAKGEVSFRANRSRFEALLRERLDIRWDHKLGKLQWRDGRASLTFESGETIHSQLVIGADGAHSQVRKLACPSSELTVLPYAVYNGKRRIPRQIFDEKFRPDMDKSTVIEHRIDQTLLQISLNDINDEVASLSYTYSRPASASSDPLFLPDRPLNAARDIPEAFFAEVAGLQSLREPFSTIFDVESLRQDRLLNWLMRSTHVSAQEVVEAGERGILLLGDAAHHAPILGSEGANVAMRDAAELAEWIAEHGTEKLGEFCSERARRWEKGVEMGEERLAQMHGVAKANL